MNREAPMQVGLVVHPRRDIEDALEITREWASGHGAHLGQVPIAGQTRRVAELIDVASCDVVMAVGGDGTALAALHAAAPSTRPVLAVACGSIGVLTSVPAEHLPAALDQLRAGRWEERPLQALEIVLGHSEPRFAINDFVAIRNGTGQVITKIHVDEELYVRMAGDGVVVATPLGSSAYTMAAGGPLLTPTVRGIVITPLAEHGGVSPPLVAGPHSRLRLSVEPGYGGSRFEVDGQELAAEAHEATVSLREEYASLVMLAEQEPFLSGLRRRGLVADSPRILVRDARS